MLNDDIKKLYIEPSSKCNLNCKICFRNSWIDEKQGLMSSKIIDEIYKSIEKLESVEKVVFAGMGEPLLNSEICNMVKKISELGKETEIITNAMLLDEEKSRRLIDSGLSYLWVSIDNSHIESAAKSIDNVIKNIQFFNSVRKDKCKLGFTFVLLKPSSEQLSKIKDFAKKYKANEINISQIIPCEQINNLSYDMSLDIGRISLNNDENMTERRLNYCPFIEEGCCFVKWNGDVVPCMQLLHSSETYLFNEKRKVLSYSFGNISDKNLLEIWKDGSYKTFRVKVKKFEFPDCTICDGCDDRKENITDCMYNQMPTCGACLWAQNIARCP